VSKPLNKMTQEELSEYWEKLNSDRAVRQSKVNRRLLDRSAETLQLVEKICRKLGIIPDTRDEI